MWDAVSVAECVRGWRHLYGRGGVCIRVSVRARGGGSPRAGARAGMRSGSLLSSAGQDRDQGGSLAPAGGAWELRARGLCGRRFEPGNRQVGASAAGVGFGGEVRGGGTRTHRVRRRGCPRAHGPRAAWRRRVAGKVPDSGGRRAPRPAGPPCYALRPGGRRRLTSGLRSLQNPLPPCPARRRRRPLPLAPARPRLQAASARPARRLRLRDSSLARKATPCRRAPALPLAPRPEPAAAEGSAA